MTADDIRHRLAAAKTMDRADPRPGQETVIRNYITDVGALLDEIDRLRGTHQPFRWHDGPTDNDPDPGQMWHYDCGGRVGWFKDNHGGGGYVCDCGAQGEQHEGCPHMACVVPRAAQLDTLRNAGQALAEAAAQLEQWDMLTLTRDGHGAATADAPWARDLIHAALANWRAACGNTTRQEQG